MVLSDINILSNGRNQILVTFLLLAALIVGGCQSQRARPVFLVRKLRKAQ